MSYKVELTEESVSFILSLPAKLQAKIQRSIQLLKEFGYSLPEPHSKKLKGDDSKGLYELRVKLGSDICRLFYFHWKDRVYVITSGYIKKTNKINKEEVLKAIKIMKLFKEGKNG